jgi:hypothetical protein
MATIKHTCENCNSKFSVSYDEKVCETDPLHCPFCAEYIFLDDDVDEDE